MGILVVMLQLAPILDFMVLHYSTEESETLTDFCCRTTLDEAANASYELTDAEYASNEVEDTWVDHLLGILVAMLQWLQPLLTPSNYDTLVASLLQKVAFMAQIP